MPHDSTVPHLGSSAFLRHDTGTGSSTQWAAGRSGRLVLHGRRPCRTLQFHSWCPGSKHPTDGVREQGRPEHDPRPPDFTLGTRLRPQLPAIADHKTTP